MADDASPAGVPAQWQRGMDLAVAEATKGMAEGGIPIGCAIINDATGAVIGAGHNRRVQKGSAILHGEMDALENAGRQSAATYATCTLYTTLSPCSMCSGACLLYGIPRIIVGENTTFLGDEELLRSRGVEVTVVNDARCVAMMTNFIENNRGLWFEDIGEQS